MSQGKEGMNLLELNEEKFVKGVERSERERERESRKRERERK